MDAVGLVHTVFAVIALVAGGGVCLLSKGTRWHRTLGHVYAVSMIGLLATAFFIYDLFGGFGPFHFAAVVSAVTLALGLATVLSRRPAGTWMEHHATWMSWSYVGLLTAFGAETLTRVVLPILAPALPGWSWPLFWGLVAAGSFAAAGAGWWVIRTRLPGALRRTPHTMRAERRRLELESPGRGMGAERAAPKPMKG